MYVCMYVCMYVFIFPDYSKHNSTCHKINEQLTNQVCWVIFPTELIINLLYVLHCINLMTDSNFLPATCEIVRSISLLPSGLSDSRPFMNLSSLSQTPNFRQEICLKTIIHSTSSIHNSQQRPFPCPGFLGFFSIFFWWVLEPEDCLLLLIINRCRKKW